MTHTTYRIEGDAFDWLAAARNMVRYDTAEQAHAAARKHIASIRIVEVTTTTTWVVESDAGVVTHERRPESVPDGAAITEHVHTTRRIVAPGTSVNKPEIEAAIQEEMERECG